MYKRQDYERLYTIDVVCHGVPSPKVYQKRLDEVTELSSSPVIKVNFRDKTPGWKRFNIVFQTENHIFATHKRRGPYMRLFLNNVSTRPSCSDCAFNNKHSLADLTIADYWGVNKPVSYTHLRAHETRHDLVCRLLLEKKKNLL